MTTTRATKATERDSTAKSESNAWYHQVPSYKIVFVLLNLVVKTAREVRPTAITAKFTDKLGGTVLINFTNLN